MKDITKKSLRNSQIMSIAVACITLYMFFVLHGADTTQPEAIGYYLGTLFGAAIFGIITCLCARPKESIGLTDDMIRANISIDEFIHLEGKHQMTLPSFVPQWQAKLVPHGQLRLWPYLA